MAFCVTSVGLFGVVLPASEGMYDADAPASSAGKQDCCVHKACTWGSAGNDWIVDSQWAAPLFFLCFSVFLWSCRSQPPFTLPYCHLCLEAVRANPSPALSRPYLGFYCGCSMRPLIAEREDGRERLVGRGSGEQTGKQSWKMVTLSNPGGLCLLRQITTHQCCLAVLSASLSHWGTIYEAWYMLWLLCSVNCWVVDSWQAHSKREISDG